MSRRRKKKYPEYVADFETVVNRKRTEVWAWSIVPLRWNVVDIGNRIETFFEHCEKIAPARVAFHNLKWDGCFIVWWLLKHGWQWKDQADGPRTFSTLISEQNQWYTITVYFGNRPVIFWDSLKLIPMSVKKIGDPKKGFGTEHQKTTIDYEGHQHAGEEFTAEEEEYIKNDVLVVKEALEMMYDNHMNALTIGGSVMAEMERLITDFNIFIPSLNYYPNEQKYPWLAGIDADAYFRNFYAGGITQVDDENGQKMLEDIAVIDFNSMYPSMMQGKSGNVYPASKPEFFKGKPPEKYINGKGPGVYYWFAHVKASFEVKPNHIPTLQIKNMKAMFYRRDYIRTTNIDGKEWFVDLYLTCTDFKLFQEQYNIKRLEWIDSAVFFGKRDLFDEFLDVYVPQKEEAKTAALRQIAKLILNNSYGKLGVNRDSSFKVPYIDENDVLQFKTVHANEITPINVACAAAVTSYARYTLIHTAQKFKDHHAFCYCDTDSIHYIKNRIPSDLFDTIPMDHKKLGCWDMEVENAERAIFLRPKTYAEYYEEEKENEKGEKVKTKAWHVTACGMSENGKKWAAENIEEFKLGAEIETGKRFVKRIPGGCVLQEGKFVIRIPRH